MVDNVNFLVAEIWWPATGEGRVVFVIVSKAGNEDGTLFAIL